MDHISPVGIIAEYNPFHIGHALHVAKTREKGATHIVAVMSGSFVQRGEPSVLSKIARAQVAVRCGVDLVVELPVAWSCATAEKFAYGGVYLLHALGLIGHISFGSECGDVSLLIKLAEVLSCEEFDILLKKELQTGITYAAARQKAVENLVEKEAAVLLQSPNNNLGVEYIRAINKIGSPIQPMTIQRVGAGHDSKQMEGKTASAFEIRRRIKNGEPFAELLPSECCDIVQKEINENRMPSDVLRLERGILACLRTKTQEELCRLPDIGEGLEHRMIQAVRGASGLEDLYEKIKTKRYSHARIRRTVMHAFLGITSDDLLLPPPYLRVLAFSERGKELLRFASKTATIPIVMKNAAIKPLCTFANRVFELESRATDFWGLATPKILPFGQDYGYKK